MYIYIYVHSSVYICIYTYIYVTCLVFVTSDLVVFHHIVLPFLFLLDPMH